jgi:Zn-finger nucleic acid-binding protein
MDEMTCPKCQGPMTARQLREVVVLRCSSCGGVFLDRADLALLTELENDWHRGAGPHTEPLPRITADMVAPPPPARPRANSFVETLFS